MAAQLVGMAAEGRRLSVDPAETFVRQLTTLLSVLDGAISADPPSIESLTSTLLTLRSTRLLHILNKFADAGSDSASQALYKASVKAGSLANSHSTRSVHLSAGFSLALEIAEQGGWTAEDGILKYGQDWVNAGQTYLSITSGQAPPSASLGKIQLKADPAVLRPLLRLLSDHVLSPAAASRPEFARNIVTPNLPKFSGTLVTAVVEIVNRSGSGLNDEDEASLVCLLSELARQLQLHPSILRPFVPRLHTAVTRLLRAPTSSPALDHAVADVVGHLYLSGAQSNGSGKTRELITAKVGAKATQAQLWLATVKADIASTRQAWEVSVSTYDLGDAARSQSTENLPSPLPEDPHEAHEQSIRQMERLIGSSRGIYGGTLLQLLQISTSRPVPVPLLSLTSLARSMLSVTAESRSRSAVDSNLHAAQAAALPEIHLQALKLLQVTARLGQGAGVAATGCLGLDWLEMVIRPLERGVQTSAPVRAAASRLLALLVSDNSLSSIHPPSGANGYAIALDPAARITLRGAKACLSEVARLFASDGDFSPTESSQNANGVQGASSSSRKKKRSRLYESDALFSGSSPRILGLKQIDEQASALACLDALPAFFPHLCTSLTPMHYDLAHTAVQLITALAEVTLRQPAPSDGGLESSKRWAHLAAGSLSSLGKMIRVASGPILGLLSPRLTDLASFALAVVGPSQPCVTRSANEALAALREVSLPSLPPVLAAKLHRDEEEADVELAAFSREWGTDPSTGRELESKTGRFTHDVGGGEEARKTRNAVKDVIGVDLVTSGSKRASSFDEEEEELEDEHEEKYPQSVVVASSQDSGRPFKGPRHSSPSRATEDMDPVKPRHRPSTPRIGSPNRVASGSQFSTSNTPGGGGGGASPEAQELFGSSSSSTGASNSRRRASSPSHQTAAVREVGDSELPPSAEDGQDKPASSMRGVGSTSTSTALATTAETTGSVKTPMVAMLVDSDDEEMPEIDINSSDEDEDE